MRVSMKIGTGDKLQSLISLGDGELLLDRFIGASLSAVDCNPLFRWTSAAALDGIELRCRDIWRCVHAFLGG